MIYASTADYYVQAGGRKGKSEMNTAPKNWAYQATDVLSEAAVKMPAHQAVYARLRDAILFGELAPGQAVTIQGVIQLLDAGMTPVREAMRRLTAEGAITLGDNRRAIVPVLDADMLEQLEFMRLTLEPELAYRAAQKASVPDIAALEATDAALNVAIDQGDVGAYLRCNYAFHTQVYALAQAPIMAAAAAALWVQFGPSLRVVCGRSGTANLPDKHAELLAALRRGAAQDVRVAMEQDIEQGMRQVRKAILTAPPG